MRVCHATPFLSVLSHRKRQLKALPIISMTSKLYSTKGAMRKLNRSAPHQITGRSSWLSSLAKNRTAGVPIAWLHIPTLLGPSLVVQVHVCASSAKVHKQRQLRRPLLHNGRIWCEGCGLWGNSNPHWIEFWAGVSGWCRWDRLETLASLKNGVKHKINFMIHLKVIVWLKNTCLTFTSSVLHYYNVVETQLTWKLHAHISF